MLISMISIYSGKNNILDIPISQEQYSSFIQNRDTVLIQEAFPNLSAPLREFLITGITPDEWVECFGYEPTDYDYDDSIDDDF
jgi:hypothetical protein